MKARQEGKWKRRSKEAAKLILSFLLGMSVTIGFSYYYGSPLISFPNTTVNTIGTSTVTAVLPVTTTIVSTVTTTSTSTQIVVQNPPPLGNFTVVGSANSTGWGTSATQIEFRPPSGPTTFAKLASGHYSVSLFANTRYRVYLDSSFWVFSSTSFCFVLDTQVTAGSQPLVLDWKC